MYCHNCGAQLSKNDKFCDSCGAQTAAERAIITAERDKNAQGHIDKTMSGSIWLTVAMTAFTLIFIILHGFERGEGRVASITATVFSVIICSIKWHYEIKNQRKWKRQADENGTGESSDHS
ncbi:MAG: zinc-ribbon domain-containing protein [Eubacteriaceae bacterium]|nr:zinc-ribbon domain-containing protein [Eubacteriaceae bacterium]